MLAKFLYRTFYTRGFSRFVSSTTAPIASGWSESCRAGFAPAERQRLGTAHNRPRFSDLLIAAHAKSLDAVLVTNDKAFRQMSNLRLEDWAELV
ncbi:hypothetical protein AGMMS50256_01510 [Betaproteobacteria bacterium]|nr:hypothetical protein AGMMS50256_01510 [Betaproteobacteria bacterium]